MVLKLKNPFKLEDEDNKARLNDKPSYAGHASCSKETSLAVGLGILTQISRSEPNILVKPALRRKPPSQAPRPRTKPLEVSCFLKTCQLCNKKLSPDKDVYMYRGDQGYCSVQCRDRQIALDEMGELETSTKKMVASHRQCRSDGRRETQILLEEFRRRRNERKPIRCQRNLEIVS